MNITESAMIGAALLFLALPLPRERTKLTMPHSDQLASCVRNCDLTIPPSRRAHRQKSRLQRPLKAPAPYRAPGVTIGELPAQTGAQFEPIVETTKSLV